MIGGIGHPAETRCPLLALSGHRDGADQCPLSEVKRTWRVTAESGPPTSSPYHNQGDLSRMWVNGLEGIWACGSDCVWGQSQLIASGPQKVSRSSCPHSAHS